MNSELVKKTEQARTPREEIWRERDDKVLDSLTSF